MDIAPQMPVPSVETELRSQRVAGFGQRLAKASLLEISVRLRLIDCLSFAIWPHFLPNTCVESGNGNANTSNPGNYPPSGAPALTGYAPPGRAVFGVPLESSLAIANIANLPAIVFRCIEYLEAKKAAQEEGIYRLSGSSAVIKTLKDRFNHGERFLDLQ